MADDYRIVCEGSACDYETDSTLAGAVPAECPQCRNALGARLEKQVLVRMSGRNQLDPAATTAQKRAWRHRDDWRSFQAVNPCDDGAEAFWVPVAE